MSDSWRVPQGTEYPPPAALKKELVATVREVIGPIATPDVIHWAPGLPKTRSGKIMRRILRKIAAKYAPAFMCTLSAYCTVQRR